MLTLDTIIQSLAPVLGPVSTAFLVLLVLAGWWFLWAAPRIKIRHNPGSEAELAEMLIALESVDEKLGKIVDGQKELNSKVTVNNSLTAQRLEDIWQKVNKP